MPDPLLQGRSLTRAFGSGAVRMTAVCEVSIDLYPGQVVLLMGPSGSGKSTLLALLSGLLPPTSGVVTALGQDLWELSESQRQHFRMRHCGFIFQGSTLFPAFSARQQLEVVLRWGEGMAAGAARRRAEEMLELLGLADKAHLRPVELSGGEKQRVAAARALIKEPTFCFADEPTGSLDWAHGQQVVELLSAAAHQGHAAVLIVTHDPRMIPYGDRVYNIEDGRLREGVVPGGEAPSPPVATGGLE